MALLAGRTAAAEPALEAAGPNGADSFCQFARGEADARAALLLAPEVFASFGAANVEGSSSAEALPADNPALRLSVGAAYSVSRLLQGLKLQQGAEAACRREHALQHLQATLRVGRALGTEQALRARAEVLERARPLVEGMLTELRAQVVRADATLEELNAAALRADALNALASETSAELRRLEALPRPAPQPLPQLVREFHEADLHAERIAADARQTQAWDLRVRGGYDQLFGRTQSLPFFATLTLSYNLGGLWQPGANARAAEGRGRWNRDDLAGTDRQLEELLATLRTTRSQTRGRLREVSTLQADLQAQLKAVEAMSTAKVRRFRDYLMLELIRLRAEEAYLAAHLSALDTLLEGEDT